MEFFKKRKKINGKRGTREVCKRLSEAFHAGDRGSNPLGVANFILTLTKAEVITKITEEMELDKKTATG